MNGELAATVETFEIVECSFYLVYVEIVRFPKFNPPQQEVYIRQLLETCVAELATADANDNFDLLPTGDGICIAITASPRPTQEQAVAPLLLAIGILRETARRPFEVRVALGFAEDDRRVNNLPRASTPFQFGRGLIVVSRLVQFAEEREILASEDYYRQLQRTGQDSLYEFFPHRKIFVKHLDETKFYSYRPKVHESSNIYQPPNSEEARFKKFAYFPPLEKPTTDRFREIGLRRDLQDILEYTYDTIDAVNRRKSFISWGSVFQTIKKIQSGNETSILIVSRSDHHSDFWSSAEAHSYLDYLRRGEGRRQTRLFVYDPLLHRPILDPAIGAGLVDIHEPRTLLKVDKDYVTDNLLMKYLYGVTIYPTIQVAIAPIPVSDSYKEYFETIEYSRPEDTFARFAGVDFGTSAFKALVIADPKEVERLVAAFRELESHPATSELTLHDLPN